MDSINITSAQYCVGLDGSNSGVKITIGDKELIVPLDPSNRHYQAILEWVEAGNTIQEAD